MIIHFTLFIKLNNLTEVPIKDLPSLFHPSLEHLVLVIFCWVEMLSCSILGIVLSQTFENANHNFICYTWIITRSLCLNGIWRTTHENRTTTIVAWL
jgi:hypothetical protein